MTSTLALSGVRTGRASVWRTCGLVLGALLMATASLSAQAHKPSDAYLNLSAQGTTIEQRLDIHLRDLDRELVLDTNNDSQLTWGEVRQRWADIQQLAQAGVQVSAGGQACTVQQQDTPKLDEHSDGRYAVLQQTLNCPGAAAGLTINYRLFANTDPTHRGIVRAVNGTQTQTAVLAAGDKPTAFWGAAAGLSADASGSAAPMGFPGFVKEGMQHIWIGIDHVLFLLALLLPAVLIRQGGRWLPAPALKPVLLEVAGIVTAFTIAHSITLALAVLDVVNPPSRWVESVIAASVVLAALNNLHPLIKRQRWVITFLFGLVHGFGFAGALKDLGLGSGSLLSPLLGFNLGVELGQLAIVAVFVPIAWLLRPQRAYRVGAVQAGSAAIALLALVWLAERALNLALLNPLV